jgi:aminoglycoside phosphotransferase (APT) family kinase protein
VYRWLSGTDAASGVVRDAHEFAADLTRVISSLRLIDTEGAPSPGEHNFFRGVPLERRDGATRAAIAALAATVDSAEVTSAWEVSLSAPRWDGSPVWIHGDLDARNLILSDGRLSGVVDWGGLGVGDPACDVMVAWKCFGVEERGIFRSAVAVDDATWVRARGWALSQALNALSYYTPQTNYVLVREAQRWLVEVLADHRSEVRGGS